MLLLKALIPLWWFLKWFIFILSTADPGRCWPGGSVCGICPGTLRRPVHQDQRTRQPFCLPPLQPHLCAQVLEHRQPLQPLKSHKSRRSRRKAGSWLVWSWSSGRREPSNREHWELFRVWTGRQSGWSFTCRVSSIRGRWAKRGSDRGRLAMLQQQQGQGGKLPQTEGRWWVAAKYAATTSRARTAKHFQKRKSTQSLLGD